MTAYVFLWEVVKMRNVMKLWISRIQCKRNVSTVPIQNTGDSCALHKYFAV